MKKRLTTTSLVFMSICVVINIIGGFLALALRLPIYLDTIGTVLAAVVLGPLAGMITGGLTSVVNAIGFDPTSIYFMPTQLMIGGLTGLLFKNHRFSGWRSVLSIALITIVGSMISSVIAAFVFGGVTSSGSSVFVPMLKSAGMSIVSAVFSTQIFSDLLDKYLSFGVAFAAVKMLPKSYMNKLWDESGVIEPMTKQ